MSKKIVLHMERQPWRVRIAQWLAPRGYLVTKVYVEPLDPEEMSERIESLRKNLRESQRLV